MCGLLLVDPGLAIHRAVCLTHRLPGYRAIRYEFVTTFRANFCPGVLIVNEEGVACADEDKKNTELMFRLDKVQVLDNLDARMKIAAVGS